MNKTLILLRGVPGSGKTSVAQLLGLPYYEADDYFVKNGHYHFDPTLLGAAHSDCKWRVENAMKNDEPRVVVSNTSITEREMAPYKELAEKYGYWFISLIVENRHGNPSVHKVPTEKLKSMEARFDIKLK